MLPSCRQPIAAGDAREQRSQDLTRPHRPVRALRRAVGRRFDGAASLQSMEVEMRAAADLSEAVTHVLGTFCYLWVRAGQLELWCRKRDSNPRPHHYEAGNRMVSGLR
jgi:hypothetical protein